MGDDLELRLDLPEHVPATVVDLNVASADARQVSLDAPATQSPDGRRLAKRHGDTRLISLKKAGVKPEALIGLLAWSCGWLDDPRPISAKDLIGKFDLAAIPKQQFVLTDSHLRSIGYDSQAEH